MSGRFSFFVAPVLLVLFVAGPTASVESFAQDAGVSGIRGPGSAGGLNNSLNDPSGIGNAGRVPPPPPPNITVPTVPSAAPAISTRVAPAVSPRGKVNRRAAISESRELRRPSSRASTRSTARARSKPAEGNFSICRGC